MDEETPLPPIGELEQRYDEERLYHEDRAAAEYAYVLAVRLRSEGRVDEARRYARECLRLTGSLPSNTLDDVTSSRLELGGVPLPERFHDGVVRMRLADLLA